MAYFPRLCYLADLSMQQYGISPERFQENQDLSSFFKILTTSADANNKVPHVILIAILPCCARRLVNIHIRFMSRL